MIKRMIPSAAAIAIAAVAIGGMFLRVSANRTDGTAVWKKSILQGESTSTKGEMSTSVWQDAETRTARFWVTRERTRYRLDYIAPKAAKGRVVISDGKKRWQYEPSQNTVLVSKVSGSPEEIDPTFDKTDLVTRNYIISIVSENEKVAGRSAYLLEMTAVHANKGVQRRWIDRKTFKTLRVETYHADGTLARSMVYLSIQFPSKLNASEFKPKFPKTAKIVHAPDINGKRALGEAVVKARSYRLPVDAPLGFQLESCIESVVNKRPTSQFVYTDGIRTLSIFVSKTNLKAPTSLSARGGWREVNLNKTPGIVNQGKHYNTLVWHQGNNRYSLISRLHSDVLSSFVREIIRN